MMISSNKERIKSVAYTNEEELQQVLGKSPELLDEYNELHTVCSSNNELRIPAGSIDLFMISETGDVIVVETKLSRNRESRREVVAQIIDYISSLAEMSYYELDMATKNRLGEVVDSIEADINLPKVIDDNLRNGRIKLIIAVDESNDDLTRLTRFLSDHTRFAIELIEIRKYRDGERELYVSTEIVKSNEMDEPKRFVGESESENFKWLEMMVDEWNKGHPETMALYGSRGYKQIRIPQLPNSLHYEFLTSAKNNNVWIRFDNEYRANHAQSSRVTESLRQFANTHISTMKKVYDLTFEKSRSQKHATSKLYVLLYQQDVDETMLVMEKLIDLTKDKIISSYAAE